MKTSFRSLMLLTPILAALVAGCATQPPKDATAGTERQSTTRPAASPVDVGVNWSYTSRGDAAIRPIQVFSLRGKTYLQMRQNQILPVVLVDGAPVPFQLEPPYIVIEGTPNRMDLVSDGWRAIVQYGPASGLPATPSRIGDPSRVQSAFSN